MKNYRILLAIITLSIFLNCSGRKHYKVKGYRPMGFSLPILFAHRGALLFAPENTFPAFAIALKQKADGIELDVNVIADSTLVVFHDKTTARTTNDTNNRKISELNKEELLALDAGSWYSPLFKETKIPLLKDVLTKYYSKTKIILDIKNPDALIPLITLLQEKHYNKDIYIASHLLEDLDYLRKNLPSTKLIFWMSYDSQMAEIKNYKIDYIRPRKDNLMYSHALELKKLGYKIVLPCGRMQAGISMAICNNILDGQKKLKKIKKHLTNF